MRRQAGGVRCCTFDFQDGIRSVMEICGIHASTNAVKLKYQFTTRFLLLHLIARIPCNALTFLNNSGLHD